MNLQLANGSVDLFCCMFVHSTLNLCFLKYQVECGFDKGDMSSEIAVNCDMLIDGGYSMIEMMEEAINMCVNSRLAAEDCRLDILQQHVLSYHGIMVEIWTEVRGGGAEKNSNFDAAIPVESLLQVLFPFFVM